MRFMRDYHGTARNIAPPGHYMVFIVNGTDVPSVAKIVKIY
jgi:hypothetical protein